MSALVLTRRFLADYARNPVNLLLLVLVPVVFVVVAAGSLVDAAKLFGSTEASAVATATAGWAAGFLAGVAMYFQTAAARDADRGLVIAGPPAGRLVTARLGTGLALGVLASGAALAALWARTGIDDPARAVAGTAMFAVIYLGIGAVVGALVRNPVNGTVLILFVWILDVFFGPAMSTAADQVATRVLPTHYVTLWMTDLPLRHGGRLGALGVASLWTVGALAVAFTVVIATVRLAHRRRLRARPGSVRDQFVAATRMGWRDWRRNPVLWLLLVAVPAVFILAAQAITPHRPTSIVVAEDGVRAAWVFDVFDLHAGTMAPIAVAALATLAGLFVVLDTGPGDRRIALVGLRPGVALAARLTVIGVATALATGVSLAIAAFVFDARQWVWYAAANALIAVTYAFLGVLLAPIFGRVAGVFIAFLIPFLDVGIGQSPMLRGEPAPWATYLPGYGAYRILIDGGLTAGFDETRALLIALAWLAVLAAAAVILVRRTITPTTGGS
ncbi:MAG TPA: hypothetical protein VFT95_18370 [Micromonosporaceae bacterium]|nr:hypothetical protein [Micromonosporaceae bacterium]